MNLSKIPAKEKVRHKKPRRKMEPAFSPRRFIVMQVAHDLQIVVRRRMDNVIWGNPGQKSLVRLYVYANEKKTTNDALGLPLWRQNFI